METTIFPLILKQYTASINDHLTTATNNFKFLTLLFLDFLLKRFVGIKNPKLCWHLKSYFSVLVD